MNKKRMLAAILSADAVEYSRLMETHESATIESLETSREVFRECTAAHNGHVVDTAGDSVLATFASAIEAVGCAIEIQSRLASLNRDASDDHVMAFRIGLNLGDIVQMEDGTVYGDGVNIAARLQSLAEPGGICISGNIYDVSAAPLDLVTHDLGEQVVKNIRSPIRTYRVHVPGAPQEQTRRATAAPRSAPRRRPSIAVLPFENLSGDSDQEYFTDGLAEDIITELSKFHALLVIARNSSFAYKGQNLSISKIGAEVGARFIVHGSVRKSGDRVRITAELVDVESGGQLWAERYDRFLDDDFAVQDEIVQKVIGILPSRIEAADLQRVQTKPTDSLEAYECVLRGKYHHHRRTAEDNRIGLEMLERAIERDPGYAQAHAWKACTLAQAMLQGYTEAETVIDAIVESLQTALSLDADDFETHRILSGVNLAQRDYDRAAFHAARALELNPNDPRVMSQYGEILTATGNAEDAVIVLERAIQVDPYQPDKRRAYMGAAEFVAGRYEDAIGTFRRISALDGRHHSYLAACHALLENPAEARRHALEVRRLIPDFDAREFVHQLPYRHEPDRDHHLRALIRAGLGDQGEVV